MLELNHLWMAAPQLNLSKVLEDKKSDEVKMRKGQQISSKDLKSFSKKKSSLGIKVKPREYRGRGGKSPSSGSKKLQRLLRTRDDKGIF